MYDRNAAKVKLMLKDCFKIDGKNSENVLIATKFNTIKDRRTSHMLIAAYQRSRQDKYVYQRQLRTWYGEGPMLKISNSKLSMYIVPGQPGIHTSYLMEQLLPTHEQFKSTQKQRLIEKIPKPPP